MSQIKENKERAEYLAAAAEMYEQLRQWRQEHLVASFDEIARQVSVLLSDRWDEVWATLSHSPKLV